MLRSTRLMRRICSVQRLRVPHASVRPANVFVANSTNTQKIRYGCFGGPFKRLSSSLTPPPSFGTTEDEILEFMRWNHEQFNGMQSPTDDDMAHWRASIRAIQEFCEANGKPNGFIHYISEDGEVISPENGSTISEENLLMVWISQDLKRRGDDGMAGILKTIVTRKMKLDAELGNFWIYMWCGDLNAAAMGRAAKARGVKKELKFAVFIENHDTPDEVITVRLDTKAMRDSPS